MSDTIEIHPTTPQPRLVVQVAEALADGQVAVLPTDSGYALACRLEDKAALARIAQIRRDDEPHHMTMICRDLSEISTYAKLDNVHYRFLKAHTPGPFTFILEATSEVPRRLLHAKKRSIGLRVPQHPVLQAIVQELRAPILSASLVLPDLDEPLEDPDLFPKAVDRQVDLVVHCGFLVQMPSTVIDMTGPEFTLVRVGLGGVPPELED
ncbi:threonylcarbamoyl-AMP synthase [Halothiobacillus diazotrophicus]|uniref:Threonylcarbamoyl-AMP synthase n=1 Tax=Halothiobacillus diazotrophicus TaxID=1860122 RepID=A0A191ZJG1_9GAMM|nr:L-threonylcarbamoyladenylate synthase [Halothiobacillus diazotrophicus]ANJ68005.1 threonylcarbamoyl-AMP synthase [Halothiobacillus diazotrophicus]